nr:MAG TPA: hypothetical protein [Crassvirales sp.]
MYLSICALVLPFLHVFCISKLLVLLLLRI